jgi:hypothetical protein
LWNEEQSLNTPSSGPGKKKHSSLAGVPERARVLGHWQAGRRVLALGRAGIAGLLYDLATRNK